MKLPGAGIRRTKLITKGHKGTFWGDGSISCLDCGGGGGGGGCKTVYVCQNSSNLNLKQ